MRGPFYPFAALVLVATSSLTACQPDPTRHADSVITLKIQATAGPAPPVAGDVPIAMPILPGPVMAAWPPSPSASLGRWGPMAWWVATPIGQEPAGFSDPADRPDPPRWLQHGFWPIRIDGEGHPVWMAEQEAPQPCVSFRIWDRALPDHFTATIAVRPVSSRFEHPPVGEIALIPCYLDPTHYLEVVVSAERIGVWLADGARPGDETGWRALRFLPLTTAVGETRSVTMTVDRKKGSLTVATGGLFTTVTETILAQPSGRLGLRAVGNRFAIPTVTVDPD